MAVPSDLLVQVKECELCHQAIRVVAGVDGGAEMAFDEPSGEDHDCWTLPPDLKTEDLMILSDECDC